MMASNSSPVTIQRAIRTRGNHSTALKKTRAAVSTRTATQTAAQATTIADFAPYQLRSRIAARASAKADMVRAIPDSIVGKATGPTTSDESLNIAAGAGAAGSG